MKSMFLAVDSR